MSVRKRCDGLTWEKMLIALALSVAAAWTLGWLAGAIVALIGRN